MTKKTFFFLLLFGSFLLLNASIEKKIVGTNKKLNQATKTYNLNYSQFQKLEHKIVTERKKLKTINNQLNTLSKKLKNQTNSLGNKKNQLHTYVDKKNIILKEIQTLQVDFVNYISQNLSILLILNDVGVQNKDDVIEKYIFGDYTTELSKQLEQLLITLQDRKKQVNEIEANLSTINSYIQTTSNQLTKQKSLRKKQITAIESLKTKIALYENKIKKINRNKRNLASLLEKLQIQKKDAIEKQREKTRLAKLKQEREKKRARKLQQSKQAKNTQTTNERSTAILDDPDIDIRQIHSSYQKVKTAKYRGKKTIAPLKNYKIISKFGDGFDKVYNLKIFNEFVVLRSLERNQKVQSVMPGKIVFADDTSTLNKTIIIAHSNGYHTIYANLSQISPQIKQGRTVPKGYVIGRVEDELTFEVVKKNHYINPLEVIASR